MVPNSLSTAVPAKKVGRLRVFFFTLRVRAVLLPCNEVLFDATVTLQIHFVLEQPADRFVQVNDLQITKAFGQPLEHLDLK